MSQTVVEELSLGGSYTSKHDSVPSVSVEEMSVPRLLRACSAIAFLGAIVVALVVGFDQPRSLAIERGADGAIVGLYVDRLSSVVVVLVTGINLLVQAFAMRYLRGDSRQAHFFVYASLLTVATIIVSTGATLTLVVVAWVGVSVCVCALLGHRTDLAEASDGVRRARRAFTIGDVALIGATAIVMFAVGDLDLRTFDSANPLVGQRWEPVSGFGLDVAGLAALLVAVAALARCALVPLPRWLPTTLAAPTPVSALLHAGVVNAGGLLIIRLSPMFDDAWLATHSLLFAGAATAVIGSAAMLVRADVKGMLVHSTAAQMGFMIVQCALGLFGAAVFHLLAHAMYKAALFLGSGSAIAEHVRHPHDRNHQGHDSTSAESSNTRRMLCSIALPTVAIALVAAVIDPSVLHHRGAWFIVGFTWLTGVNATWGWLGGGITVASVTTAGGVLLVSCTAYLVGVSVLDSYLAPALAVPGPAFASPWWVAGIAAVVAVTIIVVRADRTGARQMRAWLIVHDLANVRSSRSFTPTPTFQIGSAMTGPQPPTPRLVEPQQTGSPS